MYQMAGLGVGRKAQNQNRQAVADGKKRPDDIVDIIQAGEEWS